MQSRFESLIDASLYSNRTMLLVATPAILDKSTRDRMLWAP